MSAEESAGAQAEQQRTRAGSALALAAYSWWGLVPIYFKAVAHVGALEVLAHRVVWSVPLLFGLAALQRRVRSGLEAVRTPLTALTLAATTTLIATNWFTFIWAVSSDRVLQASLGYYINPLVSVALGFVFLQERLRRLQTLAVILATIGVVYLTLSYGEFPGVALILAVSFGLYGLLRKTAKVDSVVGLGVETTVLLPLAIGYAVHLWLRGKMSFTSVSFGTDVLLIAAGAVTAIPLLCFTAAARRLRLATIGFLQYLAPTGHFLLAVVLYDEAFTIHHLICFAFIWTALGLYTWDTLVLRSRLRRVAGRNGP
jgi:chloramphenicol-sensitive protein RarD